MVFTVSESSLAPAFHDEGYELLSRQGGGLFDDGMDMVAMPRTMFPYNQHRKLTTVALIGIAEQLSIQQAPEVLEVG